MAMPRNLLLPRKATTSRVTRVDAVSSALTVKMTTRQIKSKVSQSPIAPSMNGQRVMKLTSPLGVEEVTEATEAIEVIEATEATEATEAAEAADAAEPITSPTTKGVDDAVDGDPEIVPEAKATAPAEESRDRAAQLLKAAAEAEARAAVEDGADAATAE